ncbi:MAG: YIP1 family protein [Terrimicrobiaceae bacterium]|nr:YIP1 family protein [Terrimicrobiaceae bacterium]
MGSIHINRNRQSLGQYSDQEVADGLQSGKFLPDDLAWQEPMESWQPLSSFANLPPASGIPSPPPPASAVPPVASGGVALVWESADPPPLPAAVVGTIRQVFSKPVETFQAMPCEGGMGKPLKFYLLVSWAASAVAILYQAAAALINPRMFAGEEFKDLPQYGLVFIFVGLIVFMPVFLFLGSFVSSGILHFALMLVGGAKKPFETTFRVFCYASGSTAALQLVPICGGWFYSVASLVYCVVGLKEAHRTDLWRPILAVFLILLVCCGAIFGVSVLAVSLGYSALGAAAK